MLCTNYKNVNRLASARAKGFWRYQAIAKLDREIAKGKTKLMFLRNRLASQRVKDINENRLPAFTIEHYHTIQRRPISRISLKKKTDSFFVTELRSKTEESINYRIFQSEEEARLYNQIKLIPFEVKKPRPRTGAQVYVDLNSLEKEFGDKTIVSERRPISKLVKNRNIVNRGTYSNKIFINADSQTEKNLFGRDDYWETDPDGSAGYRTTTNFNTIGNDRSINLPKYNNTIRANGWKQ